MIVEFVITPIGQGESLSRFVAEAFRIIDASGLPHEHHAMGTNIEGEWDDIMPVIDACRRRLLQMSPRVSITLRIDDRPGASDPLRQKVRSAQEKASRRPTSPPKLDE